MCFYVKSNDWNENFFKSLFLSKINLQGKWFMHFSCNSHTSLAHCSVCLYLGLSESGTRWRPRQSGRQPPENFIGKKNQWLCPSSSGAGGKESACQSRRCKRWEFDPWACNILWRRKWKPTPIFIPGKPHGQRSPAGYSPQGHKELDMTEHPSSIKEVWGQSWKRRASVFGSYERKAGDFPGGPVVKNPPSCIEGAGLIPGPGTKILHASWPKNHNITQKQFCNKFKKDLKNGPNIKKEASAASAFVLCGKIVKMHDTWQSWTTLLWRSSDWPHGEEARKPGRWGATGWHRQLSTNLPAVWVSHLGR